MCKHRVVEISLGFWILLGWFALSNGVALTGLIVLAASSHELGHYLALRCQGVKVHRIAISVFGAEMEGDMHSLSYGGELACLLAGVTVNLVGVLIFREKNPVLAGVHGSLFLLNSLPIRPLDGGRALELVLRWRFDPIVSQWVAQFIGRIVAGLMAVALGYLVWKTGGALWLLPGVMAFFLLAVAPQ